ncbi:LPD23 domain-containing protein [Photobacterium kishitanii]|uniref:Large polyvalent protein associated domain-containing protein n=1 Tax=Photobacterium kishitanii TaxID=318456 RepID=A0A2T3KLX3_9GAMM|nr:LPD23 domain-containing protein [Photobacterium kishitanii]PSV00691.1 hypothetical protein C9J27_06000 [Photobacterium kishitanii]
MIVGAKAKKVDLNALEYAKSLFDSSESQSEIFEKTKWFVGVDGKWKTQVSTAGLKLSRDLIWLLRGAGNPDVVATSFNCRVKDATEDRESTIDIAMISESGEIARLKKVPLSELGVHLYDCDVDLIMTNVAMGKSRFEVVPDKPFYYVSPLEHIAAPTAFEPHPFLKNYQSLWGAIIFIDNKVNGLGAYAKVENDKTVIGLSGDLRDYSPDKILEVLVHELQHLIQDIEGFGRGGNTSAFRLRHVGVKAFLENSYAAGGVIRSLPKEVYDSYLQSKVDEFFIDHDHDRYVCAKENIKSLITKYPDLEIVEAIHDAEGQSSEIITPFEQYYSLLGEVEARIAADTLTKEQRELDSVFPENIVAGATFDGKRDYIVLHDLDDLQTEYEKGIAFQKRYYIQPLFNSTSYVFSDNSVSNLNLGEFANTDDILVTMGEALVNIYSELYNRGNASDEVIRDFEAVVEWLGVPATSFNEHKDSELGGVLATRFGRAFADCVYHGEVPDKLLSVCTVLSEWFGRVLEMFGLSAQMRSKVPLSISDLAEDLLASDVVPDAKNQFQNSIVEQLMEHDSMILGNAVAVATILDSGYDVLSKKAGIERGEFNSLFPFKVNSNDTKKNKLI